MHSRWSRFAIDEHSGGQSVERTHPVVARGTRRPRRLLLPLLGATALVLLSPERAHAAVRPAAGAAAVPGGTAMPPATADTPVARLLAAARPLLPASPMSMAEPHQDESTAVFTLSHHGTRTAVLSSTSSPPQSVPDRSAAPVPSARRQGVATA
jgi:hypothetical protein